MNFSDPYIAISLMGLIPAFILLIFPNIYYFIKAILISLITISLGCISITLLARSIFIFFHNRDDYGAVIFFSSWYGLALSSISSAIVLSIFIFKNDKFRKAISRIFNDS